MAESTKVYDIKGMSEYSRLQNYKTYQPAEIGTFSISEDGDLTNCNKADMSTLKSLKLPFNLNDGYKKDLLVDSRKTDFFRWEKCLKWIYGSKDGYQSTSDVDVITERGVLLDIGYTNLNFYKTPWKYEACKFKGKLYIRRIDEVEQKLDAWGLKNSYWDKRFREFVMEKETGTKLASYKILKGKIGNTRLLVCTEVDAMAPDGKHLEVKTCFADKLTSRIPLSWLKSHLGKVDILYYGMKNKQGIISDEPTQISVDQIPGMYVKTYEANAMIGFIGDVIDWVYTVIPDRDETWVLKYTGTREVLLECQGKQFIPNWYKQFVNNSDKGESR